MDASIIAASLRQSIRSSAPPLSRNFANDLEMLEHGIVMYDALYAWRKHSK